MGGRKPKFKAAEVIEAIRRANGVLAQAARILDCHRTTVHDYVNRYATVKEAYENANEVSLDLGESVLSAFMKGNIKGQSTREQLDATKFFLATKGKTRGYTKRTENEVSGAEGGPIIVDLVPDDDD